MLHENLRAALARVAALDAAAMEQARQRQAQLTKPEGSLGLLETIAIQVAGITGRPLPDIRQKAVVVMAADHGVTAEGVSAYPADVTAQMVLNFLHGGAAINVLARQTGTRVAIVDVGVASDDIETSAGSQDSGDSARPTLIARKIARGTANMTQGAAMTDEQANAAIAVGLTELDALAAQGIGLVATGEMGIGNTTAASAITACLTGRPVADVTGRGTGIDDAQLARKIAVIERAIARNRPTSGDAFDVLAKVGGLEIAGLVGVIIAGASHRMPVVVDGFIAGAAALVAVALQPLVRDYLIAGHVSVERGHRIILEHLGLTPLLDLHMRLGEGTGAVLAIPIIEAALRAQREMATFGDAGVSTRD